MSNSVVFVSKTMVFDSKTTVFLIDKLRLKNFTITSFS